MSEILKFCTGCKTTKPATPEYFARDKNGKDGLDNWCKVCKKAYRDASKEAQKERMRKWRERRADYIVQYAKSHYDANADEIREKARRYGKENRAKQTQASRKWRENNRDKVREARRLYREKKGEVYKAYMRQYRAVNKDRISFQTKEYRAKNKDKIAAALKRRLLENRKEISQKRSEYRAKSKDKTSEYNRKYRLNNIDKIRIIKQRRYARSANLPDTLTEAQWQAAIDYFDGCCAVCSKPLYGIFHNVHCDHWIPLVDPNCLGTTALNCVPLCGGIDGCNQSKSTKPAAEWLESKFGKRKAKQVLKRVSTYFAWVAQQPD